MARTHVPFQVRRATYIVGLTVLTLSLPSYSALATNASTADTDLKTDAIHEIQLRTELGFSFDLSTVQNIDRTNPSSQIAGIPLTPAENAEAVRRNGSALAIPDLIDKYANDLLFGGAWLDNKAGGVTTVGFTSPPPQSTIDTIHSLMPTDAVLRVVTVKYSQNDLQHAYDSLIATKDPDVRTVRVDFAENALVIGIPSEDDAAAESRVASRYNEVKVLTERTDAKPATTGNRFASSGSAVSGMLIVTSNSVPANQQSGCTLGWGHATNSLNQVYAVTAGHCGQNGQPFYYSGPLAGPVGALLGNVHNHDGGVAEGSPIRCDCDPVGPLSAAQVSKNYLNSNNTLTAITGSGSHPAQGQIVCHDGVTSWRTYGTNRCGLVRDAYNGSYNGEYYLVNGIDTSAPVLGGDSGAMLFGSTDTSVTGTDTSHILYGFISAGNSTGSVSSNCIYLRDVGLLP